MNSSLPAHSWPGTQYISFVQNTSTAVLNLLSNNSVTRLFGASGNELLFGVSNGLDYWYLIIAFSLSVAVLFSLPVVVQLDTIIPAITKAQNQV
jgi:hypothetical protein